MKQSLIDAILRENEHRVTLFVECGEVNVYGSDVSIVNAVYQPGPYSDNVLHHIQRLLNNAGYPISVFEDRN